MELAGFVPERSEVIEELNALQNECNIGIFGSYHQDNLTKLVQLQYFVKRKGYKNVFIASDLQEDYPRKKGEHESSYNRRLSDTLIRICNIHVFIFFYETDGQHDINTSAFGEMKETKTRRKKNVILYFDKRMRKRLASYFEEFFDVPPKDWRVEEYKENINTKYANVSEFLYDMCYRLKPHE